ncbi:MAG: hypothetical protein JNL08_13680 [Planctomycetes bacterium]|nr:hypothetical protein [Planctomycetota bacterium]
MRTLACAATLILVACGGTTEPAAGPAGPAEPPPQGPQPLAHEFGVIPHGESRSHDFVLDLGALGGEWIPLHVQLDCSCGHATLVLRDTAGHERPVDGRPASENAPQPGETLVARVTIDTGIREAADMELATSRGFVILQSPTDPTGAARVRWPLLLRFGIDAPVRLHPFAAMDLGRVPTCRPGELLTDLQGDEHHRGVRFLAATTDHPDAHATLEPRDGGVTLRVRCEPRELGNQRALVRVTTDLASGYTVVVPVTWKVVPDLEAAPMAKVSFRADLTREQTEAEASGQFVVLTDHDSSRPAEFVVDRIVDEAGRDATGSFACRFDPVPGQPRQHRLLVRYLSGQPDGFRGRIEVAKPADRTRRLPIDLVAFPTRRP